MLEEAQLRSALLDLAGNQYVLLEELSDALQVLRAAGETGSLNSGRSHWIVSLDSGPAANIQSRECYPS